MDCIPSCNPTSSASRSSSSKSNKSKEKKGVKKNKGVKLSTDPQSVAARERRHRISDRFKILQSMVPGGSKMDTVSMLEEAIQYVKFLKTQILLHQNMINFVDNIDDSLMLFPHEEYFPDEQNISLQQQKYPSVSSSVDYLHTLPQLPLEQCCFQGEEDHTITTFDANMKYWPA